MELQVYSEEYRMKKAMESSLWELQSIWEMTKPEITHKEARKEFRETIKQLEETLKHTKYYNKDKFKQAYEVINSTVFLNENQSDLTATYGWLVEFIREMKKL